MKKVILVSIFACLWSFSLYAQDKADSLYNEALKYYKESQYDKALKILKVIEDEYSHHNIYLSSMYVIYNIYFQIDEFYFREEYINKIEFFLQTTVTNNLLESDSLIFNKYKSINDKEFNEYLITNLFNIYYENKNFDKALKCLIIYDNKYKIESHCGNCKKNKEFRNALKYVDCYLKLNQPINAIGVLLPHCIEYTYISNEELMKSLINILKYNFLEEEVIKELIKAEESISIDEIYDYGIVKIILFNQVLSLTDKLYYYKNEDIKKQLVIKYKKNIEVVNFIGIL
jgi:uncharacterized protein YjgD (DUF1641 family)